MAVSAKETKIPTFAWTALNDALQALVSAVDSNRPIEGAGIRLTSHGEQGIEIARADMVGSSAAQTQGSGGGGIPNPPSGTAGWKLINVVDGSCNQYTMYVWATDPQLIL